MGKRTLAIALAKAIHCQAKADDFCGQCVNCARIADGNHPDVRTVAPLADKKEISIQQIREIERELNYRSFTGKRKIVIIDPATLMNAVAQNALLKTLEEPPQDSLIILIAPNAGGLCRPCARAVCGSASRPCRAQMWPHICTRSIRRAPKKWSFSRP